MNKYIIPLILTFFCTIYLTYLITYITVSNNFQEELNICKGMNNTYKEEVYKRDDVIGQMEQDIYELRFNLDSCESWHEWKFRIRRRLVNKTVN